MCGKLFVVAVLTLVASAAAGDSPGDAVSMREQMVETIQSSMDAYQAYIGKAALSPAVERALLRVERHRFVPDEAMEAAYDDRPLPIGRGQTISQPFIVGLMTELLDVDSNDRVLEVGTGSGYQSAVLAELVDEVFTIEIVRALGREAERRLSLLGYHNVQVRIGDGTLGWPEAAPFDGIIVTAAGIDVPDSLIQQLKPHGKLVMPVGPPGGSQQLRVITREPDGGISERATISVRFVPITHEVR